MANREASNMRNASCDIEYSESDLSGEDCVSTEAVDNRIVVSRDGDPLNMDRRVSLSVPTIHSMAGSGRRETDCYLYGNAIRGWIYALLPALAFWAIVIGILHRLIKR
jgi:hypothetical protein